MLHKFGFCVIPEHHAPQRNPSPPRFSACAQYPLALLTLHFGGYLGIRKEKCKWKFILLNPLVASYFVPLSCFLFVCFDVDFYLFVFLCFDRQHSAFGCLFGAVYCDWHLHGKRFFQDKNCLACENPIRCSGFQFSYGNDDIQRHL